MISRHDLDEKLIKENKKSRYLLKKEGEYNVCSIYKYRPDICRTWPFYSKSVYF